MSLFVSEWVGQFASSGTKDSRTFLTHGGLQHDPLALVPFRSTGWARPRRRRPSHRVLSRPGPSHADGRRPRPRIVCVVLRSADLCWSRSPRGSGQFHHEALPWRWLPVGRLRRHPRSTRPADRRGWLVFRSELSKNRCLLQCTRPADHVLDESSTLQGSPDPLEVSHVRTNACIDRNASLPAVP